MCTYILIFFISVYPSIHPIIHPYIHAPILVLNIFSAFTVCVCMYICAYVYTHPKIEKTLKTRIENNIKEHYFPDQLYSSPW